jgi:AraC-like DNA-binding protein
LSLAACAREFGDALGQTPIQYLTDWRMALVRDRLRNSEMDLAEIASLIRYARHIHLPQPSDATRSMAATAVDPYPCGRPNPHRLGMSWPCQPDRMAPPQIRLWTAIGGKRRS